MDSKLRTSATVTVGTRKMIEDAFAVFRHEWKCEKWHLSGLWHSRWRPDDGDIDADKGGAALPSPPLRSS